MVSEPRPRRRIDEFGRITCVLGIVFVLLGMADGSRFIVAAATFLIGSGYFLQVYGGRSPIVLDAMSIYMLASGVWYGLANLIGFWAIGTRFNAQFVTWRVDEFLDRAQMIAAFGVLAPPIGYWLAGQSRSVMRLPTIGFDFSDKALTRFAIACLAATWVFRIFRIPPAAFGTLGALVDNGANVAIFILSMHHAAGRTFNWTAWRRALATVVAVEFVYQLAYSYLRSDALRPVVALLLPYFMEKRFGPKLVAFGACLALVFALIFTPFSDLRRIGIEGSERLGVLVDATRTGTGSVQESTMSTIARLSTFSQLSQICRIVRDEGYKNGETTSYLVFALFPRVLWPGKPEITPGQWFAEKLGRGQRLSERRFSNAINMTIPGELFLNFGWIGALLGGVIFGWLLRLTWDAATLRAGSRNPISLMFVFIIVAQMLSSGAHLGFVLNIVFWYLLAFFMTLAYGIAFRDTPLPRIIPVSMLARRGST